MTGRQRRVRAGWTLFALDGLAVITSFLPGAPFGSITLATVVGAALLLAAVLTAWTGFAGELKHGLQKRRPGPVVFAGALAFLVMTGSIVTLGGPARSRQRGVLPKRPWRPSSS